jgi:hypothetical protein
MTNNILSPTVTSVINYSVFNAFHNNEILETQERFITLLIHYLNIEVKGLSFYALGYNEITHFDGDIRTIYDFKNDKEAAFNDMDIAIYNWIEDSLPNISKLLIDFPVKDINVSFGFLNSHTLIFFNGKLV